MVGGGVKSRQGWGLGEAHIETKDLEMGWTFVELWWWWKEGWRADRVAERHNFEIRGGVLGGGWDEGGIGCGRDKRTLKPKTRKWDGVWGVVGVVMGQTYGGGE